MQVNDVVRILANDENLFVGELGKILNCAADGSFLVQVIGKQIEGMPVWVWFMPNELVKA